MKQEMLRESFFIQTIKDKIKYYKKKLFFLFNEKLNIEISFNYL